MTVSDLNVAYTEVAFLVMFLSITRIFSFSRVFVWFSTFVFQQRGHFLGRKLCKPHTYLQGYFPVKKHMYKVHAALIRSPEKCLSIMRYRTKQIVYCRVLKTQCCLNNIKRVPRSPSRNRRRKEDKNFYHSVNYSFEFSNKLENSISESAFQSIYFSSYPPTKCWEERRESF